MNHMRPGVPRRWRAGWMATVALVALMAAGTPVVAAAHDGSGDMGSGESVNGCPYQVQFGDTLASIAQRGGVTVGEVMQVNGLHNPDLIYAGQMLIVPCEYMGNGPMEPVPMPYDGHGDSGQGGYQEPQPMPYDDHGGQGGQGGQGGYQEPQPMPYDDHGGQGGGGQGGGGQGGYQEPQPMPYDEHGGQGGQGGQGGYQEPQPMPYDDHGGQGGGGQGGGGQGGYQEPQPMPYDDHGGQGGGGQGGGGQGGYQEPQPMPYDDHGGQGGGGQGGGGQGGYQEPQPMPYDEHGGQGGQGGQGGYQEPQPMPYDEHGEMGPMPGNDWDSHPDMDFWRGSYYKDKYFSEFVEERQDPEVRFNWYTDSPGPNIPNDRFSVRWERFLTLPGGHYVFFATADDGVRVIVDDDTIIDAWKIQPATDYEADVFLHPGKHKIVVEYYEEAEDAQVSVHWKQLGH